MIYGENPIVYGGEPIIYRSRKCGLLLHFAGEKVQELKRQSFASYRRLL